MTLEQEQQLRKEIDAERSDNQRLRKIIKAVEFKYGISCFWCLAWEYDLHLKDCRVFTPDGEVK